MKSSNKGRGDKDHRNNYGKRGNSGIQSSNFKEDLAERGESIYYMYLSSLVSDSLL